MDSKFRFEGEQFNISKIKVADTYKVIVEDKLNSTSTYRSFDLNNQAIIHYDHMIMVFGKHRVR